MRNIVTNGRVAVAHQLMLMDDDGESDPVLNQSDSEHEEISIPVAGKEVKRTNPPTGPRRGNSFRPVPTHRISKQGSATTRLRPLANLDNISKGNRHVRENAHPIGASVIVVTETNPEQVEDVAHEDSESSMDAVIAQQSPLVTSDPKSMIPLLIIPGTPIALEEVEHQSTIISDPNQDTRIGQDDVQRDGTTAGEIVLASGTTDNMPLVQVPRSPTVVGGEASSSSGDEKVHQTT
ncbi:hypothetical protein B9Z19DRAFT_1138633 [Tuber borchii]|uniref:Uncharacterized protein n=1 Tax=Tuber borchii TaxID=42251 RepID=A0A2T6Z9P5_TUBBO|nr:hypothetical protein B9Z19DRAFT_1138633 [Tuber borchii]